MRNSSLKILFFAGLSALLCKIQAQTNTFPSSGNVGVGTTSPSQQLEVDGGTYITGTTYLGGVLYARGTIANDSAAYVQIGGGTSNYTYITGSVGIGTAAPPALLSLSSGIAAKTEFDLFNTASNSANRNWNISLNQNVFGDFNILTSTTQNGLPSLSRLTIDPSGNVGIGTTSPGAKLDVLNGIGASGNGSQIMRLRADYSGGATGAGGYFSFTDIGGTEVGRIRSYTDGVNVIGLDFSTYNSGLNQSALHIKGDGNIGIGTTTPAGKLTIVDSTNNQDSAGSETAPLHVVSSYAGIGANIAVFENTNGAAGNQLDVFPAAQYVTGIQARENMVSGAVKPLALNPSGGYVGIGTTNPGGALDVANIANSNGVYFTGVAARNNPVLTIQTTGSAGGNPYVDQGLLVNIIGNTANATIADFQAGGASKMVVNQNGNIGIGTASPNDRLEVSGPTGTQLSIYNSSSGGREWGLGEEITPGKFNIYDEAIGARLTIDSSGNIGIGTTSPGAKLDVAGNASVQGSLTASGNISAVNVTATGAFSALGATSFANTGTTTFAGPISSASGNLTVSSAGTSNNLLLNPNGGNVGIGTNSPGARLHVVGAGLGSAAGNTTSLLSLQNTNANSSFLNVFQTRNVAGSDWNSATTRIQQVTDVTAQGYIDFNPVGGTYGLAFGSQSSEYVRIQNGGNVGIGTTNPTQKLSVNGTIQAKEVIVQTGWSDYVFDKGYRVAPLKEIEKEINDQKHLPGIPSAKEVADHGVRMGEMEAKLLAKVEELTLHAIEQEKRLDEQADRMNTQTNQMEDQARRIARLERENKALRSAQ